MAQLTPMMQQYMETKQQYKDCILFYRLGDFYEMFFEDALTASKELEITLTGKDLRTTGALILDAPVVSARMEDCSLNEFTLSAPKADAALDRFYCANLYAEMDSGSLSALIPANANHYSYDITGGKAHCRLNGEALSLPYKPQTADSTSTGEIVIQAGNATVDLTISE